jgi:hypothetical protein
VENAIFEGPHATLTGTLNSYILPGFPDVNIQQTDLQYHIDNNTLFKGWLVEANVTPGINLNGPPWDAMFELRGIIAGSPIYLKCDSWTQPGDYWAWPTLFLLAPNGVVFYELPIFCCYEVIEVIAPVNGTYVIGVDKGEWDPRWDSIYFEIDCTVTSIVSHIVDGFAVTVDTADLDVNANVNLVLNGITGTSLDTGRSMELSWSNISFTNFFAPQITSLNPNGGEDLGPDPITISWTATDENQDELLSFTVEVSNDSGLMWKVISYGTLETSILWDPNDSYYGLIGTDEMLVRVNCTDGRYTISRTSAEVFTVNDISWGGRPHYELWIISGVFSISVIIVMITYFLKQNQKTTKKPRK